MKKMLFVNGNYNDIPLIESAHKFGYYVITSGNDPKGEAHPFGDEYCPCDYSNKEAMLKLAKEKQIDAVCSCGNDIGATTAAYICEQLGLPGHDKYQTSRLFHEKDEFKKLVKELNLPSPKSQVFYSVDEAVDSMSGRSYPCIIKPVDLGGGKGISVANNFDESVKGIIDAFQKSKLKHVVIEDFISGTQHGFICYIKNKKVVFDYSTNDYSYLNPYMVWIATGYPADGYATVRDQIISEVEKMANYANMVDGFLTIQYLMKDGQPYYLETMRRCLGNFHFKCISKDCGINLYDLFILTEAGEDCTTLLTNKRKTGLMSGFIGIYADCNGIIESIDIDEKLENKVFDKMLLLNAGDRVENYLNDKIGMLWFSFNHKNEREWFIENRRNLIKVLIKKEGKNHDIIT